MGTMTAKFVRRLVSGLALLIFAIALNKMTFVGSYVPPLSVALVCVLASILLFAFAMRSRQWPQRIVPLVGVAWAVLTAFNILWRLSIILGVAAGPDFDL